MAELPPDLKTRSLALQAAVTALGEGSTSYASDAIPSSELKRLTATFLTYLRTGNWAPTEGPEEAPWTAENAVGHGMI